jgi:hypothetical protein
MYFQFSARETNMFDISVNVGANEKVTFNLTYQEILQRVHSVYKHVINMAAKQVGIVNIIIINK